MPPWQAPIVSGVLVILLGLHAAEQMERPITASWVAGSALAGVVIGSLVALCDGPGPGTLISRFLALISPVTALLPIFGVPFTAWAYFANRGHPGVYRTISSVTFVGSLIISLMVVWMLIVG